MGHRQPSMRLLEHSPSSNDMNEHRPTIRARVGLVVWFGGAVLALSLAGCGVSSPSSAAPSPLDRTNSNRSLSPLGQRFSVAAPVAPSGTVTGVFNIFPSPSPSVIGYKLWWGVQSHNYTNSVDAKTNLTVSLTLQRGVKYYAAATGYDTNGSISPFSSEAVFPAPITNYVILFLESAGSPTGTWTNYWSQILTNPPGSVQLFRLGAGSSNSGSITRLDARTLQVINTNL